MRAHLSRIGQMLRWTLVFFVAALTLQLVPRSTVNVSNLRQAIAYRVSPVLFDYVGWEIGAITAKVDQTLFGVHPFMDEAARSQFVRDYMRDLATARQAEARISAIYTDPNIENPDNASIEDRALSAALRADLSQRQATAEAILEGQVAAVLADEGFAIGGQVLPPVAMRFARVPNLLITSPRDRIQLDITMNITAMTAAEMTALEDEIDELHDVSSLIVPLGGIALYPAMILETTDIRWAVETFAHEWLHHYLYFYPLGLYYFTSASGLAGDARTINETVADVFGKEVGRLVLARYYPDLVPPSPPEPTPTTTSPTPTPTPTPDPNAFDFASEMHETRVTVDELLANGEVNAAEAYMEERRAFFYENGYSFRKLNQAFFAFYGGYQAGGLPGVGGEDPIGPAVRDIRAGSPDLLTFIERVRAVTTRDQLLEVRNQFGFSIPNG